MNGDRRASSEEGRLARSGVVAAAGRTVLAALAIGMTTIPFVLVERFPAGDLHSHVYNAWLATLARQRALPGLTVVPGWTNALADVALEHLLAHASVRATITVVLVATTQLFLWSSFLLCRALSRRRCWEWLPLLACVAMGWTLHVGFTNWHLAASLSIGATALALGAKARVARFGASMVLLGVAATANPLPVAWSAAVLLLVLAARRTAWSGRVVLLSSLMAVVGLALMTIATRRALYDAAQLATWSGADQLWVFDAKYRVFVLAVLVLWIAAAWSWLRRVQRAAFDHPAFAAAVFTSACCLILPDAVTFPGHTVFASYLSQRSSAFAAIGWTAVAAAGSSSPARRRIAMATALLALSWGLTMARDWMRLSNAAADVENAVASLPAGARVVAGLRAPASRVQPFAHLVERACIGRCFAWGNYEAASRAFRMRAATPNDYVVSSAVEYFAIERGRYEVPTLPFALWNVHACPSGDRVKICVSELRRGEVLPLQCADVFAGVGRDGTISPCASAN